MAVHKVPQDVEAEDHFLGPLTFKQFLFGGGAAISGYVAFLLFSRGVWPVGVIFLLPTAAFAILAFPWSKDQPTDIWLAARIRFYLVPHRRIWNQDGMKELVTVTAPIRQKIVHSDGLSQSEVRNRFGALATMVDSRGWAVKGGVSSNSFAADNADDSDRLTGGTVTADPHKDANADDPLDQENSTIARQFDSMIQQQQSTQPVQNAGADLVNQARGGSGQQPQQGQQEDFWFLQQQQAQNLDPSMAQFNQQTAVTPGQQPVIAGSDVDTDAASQALLDKLHDQEARDALQGHVQHERVIAPAGSTDNPQPNTQGNQQPVTPTTTQPVTANPDTNAAADLATLEPLPMPERVPENTSTSSNTTASDPAILEPSQDTPNANTLQRQGNEPLGDGEVVIDLH